MLHHLRCEQKRNSNATGYGTYNAETTNVPQDVEQTALNLVSGPYFWYSEKGNEIDFIVDREGVLIPIEIKYQNRNQQIGLYRDEKSLWQRNSGHKDTIGRDDNIVLMPIWLLLALMK